MDGMCLQTHRAAIGSSAAPEFWVSNIYWSMCMWRVEFSVLWKCNAEFDRVSCFICLTVSMGSKWTQYAPISKKIMRQVLVNKKKSFISKQSLDLSDCKRLGIW